MKTFILSVASFISLTANAANDSVSHAKVGQTFALKQDVIFNEGIAANYLYKVEREVYDTYNHKTKSNLSCGLIRHETGESCPDYPRSIVNKGQYRVIRDTDLDEEAYIMSITAIEKKKLCTYTLNFKCVAYPYSNLNESFKNIVAQELIHEASKWVDIKDDQSTPRPWP